MGWGEVVLRAEPWHGFGDRAEDLVSCVRDSGRVRGGAAASRLAAEPSGSARAPGPRGERRPSSSAALPRTGPC